MKLQNQFIELIDITGTDVGSKIVTTDITVADDESFSMSSGIMCRTSARADASVRVLRDGSYLDVNASDVVVGDHVLTHTNSLKPVTSVASAEVETVLVVSASGVGLFDPNHSLLVFNALSNEFSFTEVSKIDKSIHKLVKNRLVDFQKLIEISEIKHLFTHPKYDFSIELANGEVISTSKVHRFSVFNMQDMQYDFIEANKIDNSIHALVIE